MSCHTLPAAAWPGCTPHRHGPLLNNPQCICPIMGLSLFLSIFVSSRRKNWIKINCVSGCGWTTLYSLTYLVSDWLVGSYFIHFIPGSVHSWICDLAVLFHLIEFHSFLSVLPRSFPPHSFIQALQEIGVSQG